MRSLTRRRKSARTAAAAMLSTVTSSTLRSGIGPRFKAWASRHTASSQASTVPCPKHSAWRLNSASPSMSKWFTVIADDTRWAPKVGSIKACRISETTRQGKCKTGIHAGFNTECAAVKASHKKYSLERKLKMKDSFKKSSRALAKISRDRASWTLQSVRLKPSNI